MQTGGTIDLLPQISEEEVVKIEKKGKLNLTGVLFVFLVVLFSLVVLAGNLWVRMEYNKANQQLKDTEGEIRGLQYVEMRQLTFNNKLGTYAVVTRNDFSADKVLNYLLDVAAGVTEVDSLFLGANLDFEIRGRATSYKNVARLWHDMAREEEYFEWISLERMSKTEDEDGNPRVSFTFTGKIIKENVDRL